MTSLFDDWGKPDRKPTKETKMPNATEEVTRKFKRPLPVLLTDEEMKKKGNKAGKLQSEIDDLRQEMNDAIAGHRKDLKEMNGKLHVLLSDLETGTEEKNVECYERKDFNRKKADVVRTDTNEVVETRALGAEEMQEQIPGVPRVTDVPADDGSEDPSFAEEKPKAKRGRGRPKKG